MSGMMLHARADVCFSLSLSQAPLTLFLLVKAADMVEQEGPWGHAGFTVAGSWIVAGV